jgi:AcrR family transcriptional regulator
MSPRPRQVSDEEILQAALRAIVRKGPGRMTLGDVGQEVGVSAAAIVQRFGSKRRLLLAIAAQGPEANRRMFESLRASHPSPVKALLALADGMGQLGKTPVEIANSLAFLQIDLIDAEFHRHALGSSTSIHEGIRGLVQDAQSSGQLVRTDATRLAWAIQSAMNGSLLNWAIHREGELAAWIRRDLETVLRPYRASRRDAR